MAIPPSLQGTQTTNTQNFRTGGGDGTQNTGSAGQSTGTGSSEFSGETPPTTASAGAVVLLANRAGNGNAGESLAGVDNALGVLADDSASIEDKLKALMSIVTDPELLGKLMVEFANMGRQNALDSRLQAMEAARGDLEAQAAETRDAAQKQLTGAIVSMVISVVVAVVSVASFVAATGGAAKALSQSKQANAAQQTATDATKAGASNASQMQTTASNMSAVAKNTSSNTDAMNNLMQAMTSLGRAIEQGQNQILNSQATIDQAEGQEAAAKATEEQAISDIAKKVVEDFEELVKSVRDFLRALMEAEAEFAQISARI